MLFIWIVMEVSMENIDGSRKEKLEELEKKINYTFKKKYLLSRALTHSSYANQKGLSYIEHNERLEFLGDSVLSLAVSEHIFKKYKNRQEGKLTKMRAGVVCEASLYMRAQALGLGEYMLIGRGEEITGGRRRISILADACEALIAAIYIDGGFDCAKKFIISQLEDSIAQTVKGSDIDDFKSRLQEYLQKDQEATIRYEVIGEEGPPHNRTFHVRVSINGGMTGEGWGKSKKKAEQEAARGVLQKLGDVK